MKSKERKTEKKKPEKVAEEEDEYGLFESDNSEDVAAKKELTQAAENTKKAKKTGPIAKSIVIWEVKPYEMETDLDALGK